MEQGRTLTALGALHWFPGAVFEASTSRDRWGLRQGDYARLIARLILKHDAHNLPADQSVLVTDTLEARRLLEQLDALELLRITSKSKDSVVYHPIANHKTHWILGAFFAGYQREEDNGYIFMAWPKSKISRESATTEMQNFLRDSGFKPVGMIELK